MDIEFSVITVVPLLKEILPSFIDVLFGPTTISAWGDAVLNPVKFIWLSSLATMLLN